MSNNTSGAAILQILYSAGISYATINGFSVLICLLATSLVCALKLYKKLVYRLALYQVLSAMALSVMNTWQFIIFVLYTKNPDVYGQVCVAVGWLVVYSQWMKLLFTTWVTFHLFCFAVLHKNTKKLELLYVISSLLLPAVIAFIPLITRSYGNNGVCYIYSPNDSDHAAYVQTLVLWDGPAAFILVAASAAMIAIVAKLSFVVCWNYRYEPITEGIQFRRAVKHLLPLTAFPILLIVFMIPGIVYDVNSLWATDLQLPLLLATSIRIPLWSLSTGVTLLVHISVAKCLAKPDTRSRRERCGDIGPRPRSIKLRNVFHKLERSHRTLPHQAVGALIDEDGLATVREDTWSILNSATHYSLRNESTVDER